MSILQTRVQHTRLPVGSWTNCSTDSVIAPKEIESLDTRDTREERQEAPPFATSGANVRAANEALKMAVTYIWSGRCVRNSTPIRRDGNEPCTWCCWHGDRVEVASSVSMWTILGGVVVDGCSYPRGRRRLALNHVQQEAPCRRQEVNAQDPGCQEGQHYAVQASQDRARWERWCFASTDRRLVHHDCWEEEEDDGDDDELRREPVPSVAALTPTHWRKHLKVECNDVPRVRR